MLPIDRFTHLLTRLLCDNETNEIDGLDVNQLMYQCLMLSPLHRLTATFIGPLQRQCVAQPSLNIYRDNQGD